MGEIAIPRKEFLNELSWWEILAIRKGYERRKHAGWEQARLIAYHARYANGSQDPIPTITRWLPFPWESPEEIPQEDIDDIQKEIDAIQNQNQNQ